MSILFKIGFLVSFIVAIFVTFKIRILFEDLPIPNLQQDIWWGTGEKPKNIDTVIRPFKIDIPREVISDLNERLDGFLKKILTPSLENISFEYGFNSNELWKIVSHWRHEYDWSKRQVYLNQFNQFKTKVNGLDLHFIRASPLNNTGKQVLPLLLLHGWPGSVREFYDILPILTTPNDDTDFVFDVIAPSLPGFGFSQGAVKPGLGAAQIAVVLHNLMQRVGFKNYFVQGGDWGAVIASHLATLYPTNVLGVHSNMCVLMFLPTAQLYSLLGSFYPRFLMTEEEESWNLLYPTSTQLFFLIEESGYLHLQSTKPDTLGIALEDTPAGLAAYILEKFSTGTNKNFRNLPDGGLTRHYALDDLLDNVMFYWVTNAATTSNRIYAESFNFEQLALTLDRVPTITPYACARFHRDIIWLPEKILKLKYRNLLHVTDYPNGGHFAAWENPKILAKDVFAAVKTFKAFTK